MVTVIVAVVIESKSPSRQEFLSLCVLCAGVGVAVYEGSGTSSSAGGIVICVLGEFYSWSGVHDELMGRRVGGRSG